MEPRIQYAKTSDGVNIAYSVVGSGLPLVVGAQIWGNLHMAQKAIDTSGYWSMDDLLTVERSVVIYDHRGCGSSDRGLSDYSLEARVRDLEAVVQSAGIDRFPLLGFVHGAATAVAYAVDHPDAVEQLIICNAFVSGSGYYQTVPPLRALRAMESMAEDDWEYLTRSLAVGVLGFGQQAQSDKLAKAMQGAMRPIDLVKFRQAAEATDIGKLLPRVAVPTLVIRDDSIPIGHELAREVATRISGAQFIVTTDYKARVRELLGTARAVQSTPSSGTAIILFADIVDSTPLTEQMGDTAFREKARELDSAVRKAIRDHDGTCIDAKTLGDGVLATFVSAKQAIEAAMACGQAGDEMGLPLHLGIHAGDVIREEGNVFGGAVNIAARISGLSAPGELLVSGTVRELARTSSGVSFEDRGKQALKGVGEAVRVFRVRLRDG